MMMCLSNLKRRWLTPKLQHRSHIFPKSWEQAQEELGSIEVTMSDSSLSSMAQPFGIMVSLGTLQAEDALLFEGGPATGLGGMLDSQC